MHRSTWIPRLAIALAIVGIASCDDGGSKAPDSGTPPSGNLANPAPGSALFVGANFWNIDWEGQDDYFVAGTDFATTTNPWKPQFLSDLAPYGVLRFMDWNLTNDANNPQAHWATRKQKTQPQNEPIAFEWQIDLCNRTLKDYWVTVPHESTPSDWQQLAQLIHQQLDPRLRVYVEWSNEVWNGSFASNGYSATKASQLGLPGSDGAESYHVYQSVRLFETFESVFGANSPRLVKVMAGQAAWTGPCDAQVTALADSTINPNHTRPDVYAIAPYLSATTMNGLNSQVSVIATWVADSASCASRMGVPLISYEGGTDSYAAGSSGCRALQHDAGMRSLYVTYLNRMATAGMKGPFMQYTHSGECWGLKENTDDSVSVSPKYRGVLDFLGLP